MAHDILRKLFWIKWTMAILIGTSIGIVIGFSVYHYFFMDKFSCCGVYG
jgi:predicted lysophospholipase L1 biosynthesis ABC-type transport system permease subunit